MGCIIICKKRFTKFQHPQIVYIITSHTIYNTNTIITQPDNNDYTRGTTTTSLTTTTTGIKAETKFLHEGQCDSLFSVRWLAVLVQVDTTQCCKCNTIPWIGRIDCNESGGVVGKHRQATSVFSLCDNHARRLVPMYNYVLYYRTRRRRFVHRPYGSSL